jgi:hypothetical protein
MSQRYPGGLITKTPVTPNVKTAPGVWTIAQALQYQKAGIWPIPADPYFNQTVLLLHGDGTNGAQNNTFLDSSTNSFTITRAGNTTQGTFSPFSLAEGQWSNYFDGNDYLSFADSADWAFSTGDFTIQAFINLSALGSTQRIVSQQNAGSTGIIFRVDSDNKVAFYINGSEIVTSTTTLVTGLFYHVCVLRSGSSLELYVNGVSEDTATNTTDISDISELLTIGAYNIGGALGEYLTGYISNVSILKGTATAPPSGGPTTPLSPSTTNQKLLTCYSNRFVDANTATTAKTITVNGNPSVQPFSPFAPSAVYSPSVNGGSGYFDGTGDYLTVADNAAFQVGSGTFTLECWVYLTTTGTDIRIYSYQPASGTASVMNLYRLATNVFALALRDSGGSGYTEYTTTSTVLANTWYHVAAARDASGNIAIWVNGARENSTASSTQSIASGLPGIGGRANGTQIITGYLSNLRLVKATDVYGASNTSITVPTTPLTAISQHLPPLQLHQRWHL